MEEMGILSNNGPPHLLPTFKITDFKGFLLKLSFLLAYISPLAARTKIGKGARPFTRFFTPT